MQWDRAEKRHKTRIILTNVRNKNFEYKKPRKGEKVALRRVDCL